MKGWIFQKSGTSSFYFTVDEQNNLLLYYEDNKNYPKIMLNEDGDAICEYKNSAPTLSLDGIELSYTYENNPVINIDENYNIIQSLNGAMGFDKMFYLDENGDLIYEYSGVPLDIEIDKKGNVLLHID